MEQIFIVALLIAVSFVCFKVIDSMIIKKEQIGIKDIVKDALLVYLSSMVGMYAIDYIQPFKPKASSIQVFTDSPNF